MNPTQTELPAADPHAAAEFTERRAHPRYAVEASATLILTTGGISVPGRILNLGRGGCRFQAERRIPMGIYSRVEAEFYLRGLSFRLAGVTQAIHDQNTYGIRFLHLSERRLQQLSELIGELALQQKAEASAVD